MDTKGSLTKPKRIRKNPVRKWTYYEEKALIEFLMENANFERPTSQTFYRRFSNEKNVNIEWKIVRSKVRNMRMTYNKAKTWLNSTFADGMDEPTLQSTLLKMCSFYNEFEKIFQNKSTDRTISREIDSGDPMPWDSDFFCIPKIEVEEEIMAMSEDSVIGNDSTASNSQQGGCSQSAFSDIVQLRSEMVKLKKIKMDHDMAIKEKELQIRERELALKEREVELRAKEIESQEKIKILKFEMKERVAMEKLKYKYK